MQLLCKRTSNMTLILKSTTYPIFEEKIRKEIEWPKNIAYDVIKKMKNEKLSLKKLILCEFTREYIVGVVGTWQSHGCILVIVLIKCIRNVKSCFLVFVNYTKIHSGVPC